LIEAGPHAHVKISDFGLARAVDDASLTQSGMIAGTPMFMSPEQALGETLDHRTDLFSLGSVLYTMTAGRPPFRASGTHAVLKRVIDDAPRPIPEIIPEAPAWLCDIISRLHAKKPEDRIATAREVEDLLARGAETPPPSPAAPSPRNITMVAPAREPRSRLRRRFAIIAVILALVLGVGLTEAAGVSNIRGTVIRLAFPEGILVVEADDPEVGVRIDGTDLVITGAGIKELRLKVGSHAVETTKGGEVVRRELVTVTKDGRQVVKISREAPPKETLKETPAKQPADAAAWERSVAGLLAVKRSKAISDRLKELNPQFGGQITFSGIGDTSLSVTGGTLGDISPLRAMSQAKVVHLDVKNLTDISPVRGLNLTQLDLFRTAVTDLSPLRDMKTLVNLDLSGSSQLTDISPVKSMSLQYLTTAYTGVRDLTPLKDTKLMLLNCGSTNVTDFSPLKGVPLQTLLCENSLMDDAGLEFLKDSKTLKHINLKGTKVTAAGIDGLRRALPKCKIVWNGGVSEPANAAAWELSVAGLSADKLMKAVDARLAELNPGYAGKAQPKIEQGVVTGLALPPGELTDISPVRVLTGLVAFKFVGTKVRDLSPLKGLKIRVLEAMVIPATDLSPLQGMPLVSLDLYHSPGITDLTPLKGMPLQYLNLTGLPITDISILKDIKSLRRLVINEMPVTDLSPLRDKNIFELFMIDCKATDLDVLKTLPLTHLGINDRPGLREFLKSLKGLERINDKPAA
ncbi:protein kinase domain-containing protein, partial [Zavarzinella formosa]|uniref:protein kinase domain-containing protein n=1 Tax=Zavarzinella formosa TaxID=360055 RepID=UPI00138B0C4E